VRGVGIGGAFLRERSVLSRVGWRLDDAALGLFRASPALHDLFGGLIICVSKQLGLSAGSWPYIMLVLLAALYLPILHDAAFAYPRP
jgi:hypothetical protein